MTVGCVTAGCSNVTAGPWTVLQPAASTDDYVCSRCCRPMLVVPR